ncbi:hypothetical protein [Capnocytophaga sp.]|uniref:hypothetical protein n=1 Tax=Capnocytophaga sp. TaxID=44737 RepID=UPI0026DB50D2|nr:hypothetical protein [Capnocytophaga sp.]MDO5105908.1 hypothetical protein [Capnocytophaga sp.]
MRKLIHFLILPCSEVSFLIEKQLAGRLSFVEKLRLRFHLIWCNLCRSYRQKATYLDNLMRKQAHKQPDVSFDASEVCDFQQKLKRQFSEMK